jgi:hypothetical protein
MGSSEDDPLIEMMGTLLERWDNRYSFNHDLAKKEVAFERGSMIALVHQTKNGMLDVVYEHAPGETTIEPCTPSEAAAMIEVILFRQTLHKVKKNSSGNKPWWMRLLRL